ncbi:MAG: VWA domain-containing protein, partial [Firmicutes bacterium]|nr:VWA domain-containing protein [Bacillota bacterium]
DASGKQDLLDVIDDLTADGGTFTQAGLRQARLLLESSTADNKSIVLLSDGEPTYSYEIKNIKNNLNENYFTKVASGLFWSTWHTRDDLSESVYNYSETFGGGSSLTTRISGIANTYHYHHGHSAIAESRFAGDAGYTIYSVGLYAGDDGQDILNRIALGNSYEATEDDLEAIFQDIAGSISDIAAARNAKVTDPLGCMFSIIPEEGPVITVNRGTAVYDPQSKTITWSGFTVSEGQPATMSYIVQIDASAQSGVLYPTNKDTFVDYKNINDQNAKKYFDVPKVKIEGEGVIKITKSVQGGDSNNKRFAIYLIKEGSSQVWSVLLANGEIATITGLGTGTYTIREVVPMGYESVGINPLTVTFTAGNPTAVVNVTVTNKKVDEPWFRDDDEKTNTFKVIGNW